MAYTQKNFPKNKIAIENKTYNYYSSPILIRNDFRHGFFTKISSEINLSILSKHIDQEKSDCILNQVHSNHIVFGSKTNNKTTVDGDGLVCDKQNQNLWIYTADCMPILFADRRKRFVAAVHCGRVGLKCKIINNAISIFDGLGTSKEDLLVAIGPSISKKNYLINKEMLRELYKKSNFKENISYSLNKIKSFNLKNFLRFENPNLIPCDLKKLAYIQLLNQNIPDKNIDITELCTYESNHEFHSWRKTKTTSRQWNFISS